MRLNSLSVDPISTPKIKNKKHYGEIGETRHVSGNSAYANAAGQGCASDHSRMGKSAHLRQKTLNKLSGSH